jgi:branched-chain amino acid transport system substrate-binding protein
MGRRHGAAALSGLLLATACGGAAAGPVASFQGTVQIALVGVFSGPSGWVGDYLRNSLQIAVDDLNAGGGLLGQRVDLVAADDEMQPAKAAELVREHLADGDVKLLVGPSSTDTLAAARQRIGQSGIPDCLPTPVTDDALAAAASSFGTAEGSRTRVTTLLSYVQRKAQAKRIGLLMSADADGQTTDAELRAQAQALGLQYTGSAPLPAAGGDMGPAVQQLVAGGAQAVVLPDDPIAAAQAVQALQASGARSQVLALGFEALAHTSYPQLGGDAAMGTVFAASIHSYLTDVQRSSWPPAYRTFVDTVKARYGYATDSREIKGLPAAADCVQLWARAVREANSFAGDQVIGAWERLNVAAGDSILGTEERFAPHQHSAIAGGGMFVYQWARAGTGYRLQQLMGQ